MLTRSSVCHAQKKWLVVDLFKVLVLELLAIDALAARSISHSKVSALDHEAFDDAVEG